MEWNSQVFGIEPATFHFESAALTTCTRGPHTLGACIGFMYKVFSPEEDKLSKRWEKKITDTKLYTELILAISQSSFSVVGMNLSM